MNITKREKLLMTITLVALFTGILIGAQMFGAVQFNVGDRNEPHGYFTVEVRLGGTELALYEGFENLITTIGKKHARNLMGSLNSTYTTANNRTVALSLSTDATPLASWTKLPNEITTGGLDRKTSAEITFTVINGTAYRTEYTWTATSSFTGVQCTGVSWNGVDNSDNVLYAAGTFTSTNLNVDDTIKITYTLNYG